MKIEILYPSIANLYGEITGIEYLKQCIPDAEFIYTELLDRPCFADEKVDMVYLGYMTEHGQKLAIDALMPYKDRIEELIQEDVVFLAVGNALGIFGQYIVEDGNKTDCLGLFPVYTKRNQKKRYSHLFLGEYQGMKIVGFKAQFDQTYGDIGEEYLFDVIRGAGLNPDSKCEGLHRHNFMATYVVGPILVMNPLFTKYILTLLGVQEPKLAHEDVIMQAYEKRLAEFTDSKLVFDN